ncbi:MAG: hypothetical protein JWN58_1848 [Gammaproteobacteria bacterium]|nr:hypothetical protein [Gammaproteobacteria bacterium]
MMPAALVFSRSLRASLGIAAAAVDAAAVDAAAVDAAAVDEASVDEASVGEFLPFTQVVVYLAWRPWTPGETNSCHAFN